MWPTGQFNYPVAHLDDEEIKHVEDTLPDNVVEMIFRQWDKKGIDFTILKMLGIDEGIQMLAVMLLKRYIQFSQNPLSVSYTFDCDDLSRIYLTQTIVIIIWIILKNTYVVMRVPFWEL